VYAERNNVSLEEAVVWAGSFPQPVTLYIYDPDSGIYQLRNEEVT
jgi:hypothetical protein